MNDPHWPQPCDDGLCRDDIHQGNRPSRLNRTRRSVVTVPEASRPARMITVAEIRIPRHTSLIHYRSQLSPRLIRTAEMTHAVARKQYSAQFRTTTC